MEYDCIPMRFLLKNHDESTFPAMNVYWHDEPVANDNIYDDGPYIYDGSTYSQFFVVANSLVSNLYGMKTDK